MAEYLWGDQHVNILEIPKIKIIEILENILSTKMNIMRFNNY